MKPNPRLFETGLAATRAMALALDTEHAQTIRKARVAFERLAGLIASKPLAITWLADSLADESTPDIYSALADLAARLTALHEKIAAGIDAHTAHCTSEQKALQYHFSYAVERMRELEKQRNAATMRKRGDAATLAKRAKLSEAGISQDEIERLAPLFDSAKLDADLAAIDTEYSQLAVFINSADLEDAPNSFDAAVADYRTILENTRRMRGIEGERLAVC